MPGSGKSTLGRKLATQLNKQFIDTDGLIEADQNMSLQAVVNRRGLSFMRQIEERILSDLVLEDHVVATGGSAVYSKRAMRHLSKDGIRVYLNISLATLIKRVRNTDSRGLVKLPSYSLPRLYAERAPLYQAVADIDFTNDWPSTALSIESLIKKLERHNNA